MSEKVETGLGVELGGINEFCAFVNRETRAKGFWEQMDEVLERLNPQTAPFVMPSIIDSEVVNHTVNAFMTQKIMLIVSELGEAVEAMRENRYGLEQKDTFEDELADALLRLCDLCAEAGVDIEKQMAWKINYNRQRENMHGKQF